MGDRYLSSRELLARWKGTVFEVEKKTLDNWRMKGIGRGPRFRKFGNRVRYLLSDVERFEATGQHWSEADPSPEAFRPPREAHRVVAGRSGSQDLDALKDLEAEVIALGRRQARLTLHYRWTLQRMVGRRALNADQRRTAAQTG